MLGGNKHVQNISCSIDTCRHVAKKYVFSKGYNDFKEKKNIFFQFCINNFKNVDFINLCKSHM